MITVNMAGVVVRRDGKLLTVLGTEEQDGETVLHIQGAATDFWGSPRELYQRGYRLVAAKPAIWDLWRGCGYGLAQLILCQEPAQDAVWDVLGRYGGDGARQNCLRAPMRHP